MPSILLGEELRSARLAAEKADAEIVTGDIPLQMILTNIVNSIPETLISYQMPDNNNEMQALAEKLKIPPGITEVEGFQYLKNLVEKDPEARKTLLEHRQRWAPRHHDALYDLRDQYITRSLMECGGKKVVAVVMKFRLEGIKKYWNLPERLKTKKEILNLCNKPPDLRYQDLALERMGLAYEASAEWIDDFLKFREQQDEIAKHELVKLRKGTGKEKFDKLWLEKDNIIPKIEGGGNK